MTFLNRVRVLWSGSAITGPGVSTFYTVGGTVSLPASLRTFFDSQKAAFPNGVHLDFPNLGDVIDDATGDLVGTWNNGTVVTPVVGLATDSFSMGVGMQIRWHTAGITHGRRVRGSTYLVPVSGAIFDIDGSIDAAVITGMTTAANTLLTAEPSIRIWSPPFKGSATVPARGGTSHGITGVEVLDRTSWLRTRRT